MNNAGHSSWYVKNSSLLAWSLEVLGLKWFLPFCFLHSVHKSLHEPSLYSPGVEVSYFFSVRKWQENRSFCIHLSADWPLLSAPAQNRQSTGRFNVKLSDAEAAVAIRAPHWCLQQQRRFSFKEQPLASFLMKHISSWYLFLSLYLQREERDKLPES